jgi:hypothetical protein
MTDRHLDLAELLQLRAPDSEPGTAAHRAHVAACAQCRGELARLEQRVARLRALPTLRPARDRWPAVQAQLAATRRLRLLRRTAWASLAAAATAAVVVGVRSAQQAALVRRDAAELVRIEQMASSLEAAKARSQALEASLQVYAPETRALDGRTAALADALQDRIARLDVELMAAQLEGLDRGAAARDARLLDLWKERVGLLDALVDVRVTRASNVGL